MIPQFSIIREAVEALNLHHLEMEGYEADDLIATYANMALAQGLEVVIVSGDKDLMQLIRPGVEFYDPMKDKFFSPEDVKEKFGVYPEQVVDVQALAGDTTDNIPGIPGIGLKTAAQLVNDFGSLEGVLTKAGEIKQNKRRETILANIENARISLQLVTLRGDVPVDHRIAEYKCLPPEMAKLDRFIETYGFRSIRPRLEKWVLERCNKIACQASENTVFKSSEAENENSVFKSPENAVFKQPEKSYELIQTEAKLKYWVDLIYKSRVCSIAAAYNGPDPVFDNIVGLAVAVIGDGLPAPALRQLQRHVHEAVGVLRRDGGGRGVGTGRGRGVRGLFLLAAGRQTQRHDQCQQHRHKLLHLVFLLNCGCVAA